MNGKTHYGAWLGETLMAKNIFTDEDKERMEAHGWTVKPINPITHCRIGAGFSSNEEAEREIAESKERYGHDGLD